jgi:hypothetical protein
VTPGVHSKSAAGTAAGLMRCFQEKWRQRHKGTTKRTTMPHVEGRRIVETATEARAARPGRPVLYVLIASTLAIIALFSIIYLHFFT